MPPPRCRRHFCYCYLPPVAKDTESSAAGTSETPSPPLSCTSLYLRTTAASKRETWRQGRCVRARMGCPPTEAGDLARVVLRADPQQDPCRPSVGADTPLLQPLPGLLLQWPPLPWDCAKELQKRRNRRGIRTVLLSTAPCPTRQLAAEAASRDDAPAAAGNNAGSGGDSNSYGNAGEHPRSKTL